MNRQLPWIHIELVPLYLQIRNLRRFTKEFYLGLSLHPEYAERVGQATAELLEVVAQATHADWVRFDLRLFGLYTEISAASQATRKQRETLQQLVSEVSEGLAREAFAQSLERENVDGIRKSGLCRLRHEAGAELCLSPLDEDICLVLRIPI